MNLHFSGKVAAINSLRDQFALLVRVMPLIAVQAALIAGAVHTAHLVVMTIQSF